MIQRFDYNLFIAAVKAFLKENFGNGILCQLFYEIHRSPDTEASECNIEKSGFGGFGDLDAYSDLIGYFIHLTANQLSHGFFRELMKINHLHKPSRKLFLHSEIYDILHRQIVIKAVYSLFGRVAICV